MMLYLNFVFLKKVILLLCAGASHCKYPAPAVLDLYGQRLLLSLYCQRVFSHKRPLPKYIPFLEESSLALF